ncbi:MAG: DNA polymerase III subunit alpha [Planctomycetota bacterium]
MSSSSRSPSLGATTREATLAPTLAPTLLALRSAGSLLRGLEPIAKLIEAAAKKGWHCVAVAEYSDLGTIVEAAAAGARAGIQIISAAEIDDGQGRSIVIVARDKTGLEQLHQLVSLRRLAQPDTVSDPAGDFDLIEHLANHHSSLSILTRTPELAQKILDRLGSDVRQRIFIEIDRLRDTNTREQRNRAAAEQLGIGLIASTRVGMLQPTTKHQLDLLEAVRCVSTIERIRRDRPHHSLSDLSPILTSIPDPGDWQELYSDLPEALQNAARIGTEAIHSRQPNPATIFPPFPIPTDQTAFGQLYQQCHRGLLKRYRSMTPAVLERLAHELHVIDTMGFVPYFLVVGDIVAEARRLGIECAGRGSGAASIVSYALGITQVDPLAHDLRFERFLYPERKKLPDIDIDLCWQGRDQVIAYVYRRYGAEKTAMICTRTSLQVRSALRETARAHGMAPLDVDKISRRLPTRSEQTISKLLGNDPALAAVGLSATSRNQLLEDAEWLRGRPHHRSIHPGGICICDRPIQRIASVERAAKGLHVTQLDMYSIEATGLIKIDLLGNRCVSEIGTVRDLVEEKTGTPLQLDSIPQQCTKTEQLLSQGQTLGCFQLESPAMRSLLRQMRARNAKDTIQAIALIRPGPASGGLKESFCRRVHGLEQPTPPHPCLTELLADQQGLLLYEENVMEVIALVTGKSLAEGDQIRRSLVRAHRSEDQLSLTKLSDDFIARAIENGFGATEARQLWQYLLNFSHYCFNKSHSASYGLLAWRSAWLKTHYPAEFFCALFRHHNGMYPFSTFVAEAQRNGISLKLPCVHRSSATFTLEKKNSIRMPLTAIRGSRQSSIESIFAGRPFSSPEDLMQRTKISRFELEEWVLAGALDGFSIPRPRLLWRVRTRHRKETSTVGTFSKSQQHLQPDLSGIVDEGPDLIEFPARKILAEEIRLLGAGISRHPMSFHRELCQQLNCVALTEIEKCQTAAIRIAGFRIASRQHSTSRGPMGFITLEDEQAICEVTCFASTWSQIRPILRDHSGPLLIEGKVEEHLGSFSIIAKRVTPLLKESPSFNNARNQNEGPETDRVPGPAPR